MCKINVIEEIINYGYQKHSYHNLLWYKYM
jgi:hypothetical protein